MTGSPPIRMILGSRPSLQLPAVATVVLSVAPVVTAMEGGSELNVGPCQVEWFDAGEAVFCLLGSLLLCLIHLDRDHDWRQRFAPRLSLLGFLVTAALLWVGSCGPEVLSLVPAEGAVAVGWLGLLGTVARRPSKAFADHLPWRALAPAISLGLGWLALLACVHLDQRELESRMGSAGGMTGRGDVILIVADALRADALSSYGGTSTKTAFLDRLAADSAIFEMALSHAPWTVPSMASMMTGLYPSTLNASGANWKSYSQWYRFPPDVPRLVERFAEAGYRTAGFVKNSFLSEQSGFADGYEVYDRVSGEVSKYESGDQLVRAVLRWAKVYARRLRTGSRAPFFLYVHFMDPHASYLPPRSFMPDTAGDYQGPFDGRTRTVFRFRAAGGTPTTEDNTFLWNLYAAEVDYLDAVLTRLHRGLSDLGLWTSKTTVVFTADHGEQFGEHGGYFHGHLHIENLHVPLMIRHPGLEAHRIPDLVQVIDVAPTVLELMGLPPLPRFEGRSLLSLLRGGRLKAVPVISRHRKTYRVTAPPYALIVRRDEVQLYDLEHDPRERRTVAAEYPEIVRALRAHYDSYLAREQIPVAAPVTDVVPIDRETREALEAIGYVE